MKLSWKNLNLGKKFGFGFGSVLLLLLIVSTWSISGISDIVGNAQQVIAGNKLNGMLADKEVDHLNWVNKINALLTNDNIVTLKVETDDHECGFGKWLYGEERKHAEKLVPSLAPLLKEIEAPHRMLHETAISIGRYFKQADSNLPAVFSQQIVDHLNWAATIRDVFLTGKTRLEVQTDFTSCELGTWLQSAEAQKAYSAGDEDFKSAWDSMRAKHEKLHESVKTVQDSLSVSPQQALAQYEKTTLPLLAGTVEKLKYLYNRAELELEGMREANNIYASETLPALSQTQDLLHRIREEAKQHIMTDHQMLESAVSTRSGVILFSSIAIIAGVFLAFTIAIAIVGPLRKCVGLAQSVAQGELTQTINVDQSDEIGVLADSLNQMVAKLRKMFEKIVGGVETLTSSSTELSAISQQMAASAEQSSHKAHNVSASAEEMNVNMQAVASVSEQTSNNMQLMASAAEQMTSTISEITTNTENGRRISGEAVDQTKLTSVQVGELGSAVEQIGKVTETISEISEQTNLLALNATIEAARAGEAGKGFAVVANEIKELAKQTAVATREIGERITNIQQTTGETVGRIDEISTVIRDLSEIVTTVASAMEEQSVATREIANNVNHAAQGIEETNKKVAESTSVSGNIAQDMTEVNQTAQEISASSSQVSTSARDLSSLAEQLNEMLSKFKV